MACSVMEEYSCQVLPIFPAKRDQMPKFTLSLNIKNYIYISLLVNSNTKLAARLHLHINIDIGLLCPCLKTKHQIPINVVPVGDTH